VTDLDVDVKAILIEQLLEEQTPDEAA